MFERVLKTGTFSSLDFCVGLASCQWHVGGIYHLLALGSWDHGPRAAVTAPLTAGVLLFWVPGTGDVEATMCTVVF